MTECGDLQNKSPYKVKSLQDHNKLQLRIFFSRTDEYTISNKGKGSISKQVLQEHKTRQIFRKTNIYYPVTPTRTCA